MTEYGWGVIMIGADATSQGWAFTVGLRHTHGLPELAMFGLDVKLMMRCLNFAAESLRAGTPAVPGTRVGSVLERYPVRLKSVDPGWHRAFFGTALWFYRDIPGSRFLQLVWPDRTGSFPDEPAFAQALCERQPSLWLHPRDHAAGAWTSQL